MINPMLIYKGGKEMLVRAGPAVTVCQNKGNLMCIGSNVCMWGSGGRGALLTLPVTSKLLYQY